MVARSLLRRQLARPPWVRPCCVRTAVADAAVPSVVFLGTPECACCVLDALLDAEAAADAPFRLAAVVSQPGKPRGRGRGSAPPPPSPVAARALARGVPPERLLTPASARDAAFLEQMKALAPTLCVTAAYGNFLPAAFLQTPRFGTLNIHPSLLPRWRGAAPVQRALEAGDRVTGVSLAYTVLAMDSGPVLAAEQVALGGDEQCAELLQSLFQRGAALLLRELAGALDGSARARAVPQAEEGAVAAPKLAAEEAGLRWSQPARALHNRVRAFQAWPGARAHFSLDGQPLALKVLSSRVCDDPPAGAEGLVSLAPAAKGLPAALRVRCGDGAALELVEVQAAGGRPMSGGAFWAGLRGRELRAAPPPEES